MKESKLIFKTKYTIEDILQMHQYTFNPMNPMNQFSRFVGIVIEVQRVSDET